ncbi:hypothetical protein ACKKBG_A27045 [Auxenochlorella protothecoides x Auxenochlorella symbiontica]
MLPRASSAGTSTKCGDRRKCARRVASAGVVPSSLAMAESIGCAKKRARPCTPDQDSQLTKCVTGTGVMRHATPTSGCTTPHSEHGPMAHADGLVSPIVFLTPPCPSLECHEVAKVSRGPLPQVQGRQFRLEISSATSAGHTWTIQDYVLEVKTSLGEGGLGTVYRAEHSSGHIVAMKIGNAMEVGDFTWQTFLTEWNVYVALTHKQHCKWIPRAFQFGLHSAPTGTAPWMTMELLGPSLHDLRRRRVIAAPQVKALGSHALDALQWLHGRGYLHRDVKPENLVMPHGWVPDLEPAVRLIDLGMAQQWQAGQDPPRPTFAGTPDYASTASLYENELGPRDDMESLAYTLLYLWMGKLPWAGLPDMLSERTSGPNGWTREELAAMAENRESLLENAMQEGGVPAFLEDWLEHCLHLQPKDLPDYGYLRSLLDEEGAPLAQMGPVKGRIAKPLCAEE